MIPKIFHLTSKNKDLPPKFQKNVDIIRGLYPEYEIMIHDDNDIMRFIKKNYRDYHENTIVDMPKFILVVDTVRYMWMDHFGGIYCDMDVLFRKRFEFDDGAVFVEREWTYPKDISITDSVHNCLFASEPKHPVWTEILNGIARNARAMQSPSARAGRFSRKVLAKLHLRKPSYPLVFNVTGPNAISKIITQRSLLEKYNDIRVVPGREIFQAGMSKGKADDASFVHEAAGSWKE
jgi:mannosyltransferase OCH1-like enzyme